MLSRRLHRQLKHYRRRGVTAVRTSHALVCSDLHLGDPRVDSRQVLYTLHKLIGQLKPRTLVLAGDIFEGRPGLRRWLGPMLDAVQDVPQVVYVLGNHDPPWEACKALNKLSAWQVVEKPLVIQHETTDEDLQVRQVAVEHGHRWDSPLARWRPLVWFTSWLNWLLWGLVGLDVQSLWRRTRVGRWLFSRQVRKLRRSWAISHPHAQVISGHTHIRQQTGDYVNTGSAVTAGWVVELAPDGTRRLFSFSARTA